MANINMSIAITLVLFCLLSAVMCEDDSNVQARTFGHHFLKRISFAIIPAAFIVGMITTLLGALTIVSIKGLGVGVILLILTIGQMIAKSIPAAVPLTYAASPQPQFPIIYKDW